MEITNIAKRMNIEEDNPSIPSIKFIELIISTNKQTVKIIFIILLSNRLNTYPELTRIAMAIT